MRLLEFTYHVENGKIGDKELVHGRIYVGTGVMVAWIELDDVGGVLDVVCHCPALACPGGGDGFDGLAASAGGSVRFAP